MKKLSLIQSVFSVSVPENSESPEKLHPSEKYGKFCRPDLEKLLALLKLNIHYVRAKGDYLFYADKNGVETPVLDLLGGYGSTALGHNHPEIKTYARELLANDIPFHAQASIRGGAAKLAEHLSAVAQGDYIVTFSNSGTEAVEAALKHALLAWNESREQELFRLQKLEAEFAEASNPLLTRLRLDQEILRQAAPVIFALEGSFHGKTAGSLSVTANRKYGSMYAQLPVEARFLKREILASQIAESLRDCEIELFDGKRISRVALICLELVQGEGGIRVLSPEFVDALAKAARLASVPLLVDEVQTGFYRTGPFLASHHYKIKPEYLTLGKSLGGGIAKIGAFLVARSLYQGDFGLVHTSTFAEDDYSALIGLKALETLERDTAIAFRAKNFERRLKEHATDWQERYPGVIKEVRGAGFMMGLEFSLEVSQDSAILLDVLGSTSLATYFFASYLLHKHGVRVAATLNDSHTIRLEPSVLINDQSIDHAIEALASLVKLLYERRYVELSAHTWDKLRDSIDESSRNRQKQAWPKKSRLDRVVFLSHFVNARHLKQVDPLFKGIADSDRDRFINQTGPLGTSTVYHEQEVTGANGRKVLVSLRGITVGTEYFEDAIRSGSRNAFEKVKQAMEEEERRGAKFLGLGQFTSIVSGNGRYLSPVSGLRLTTGNSLTVGYGVRALERMVEARGLTWSQLQVGIVGVAGNIGNVCAQILGDKARAMTLLHRESFSASPKFQEAVQRVLANSNIDARNINLGCDPQLLSQCDVVVCATNSSQQLIRSEHLKENALVLDLSVPSNIDRAVFRSRTDVECFQGGLAQLPLGQKMETSFVPTWNGEIYACMAETLTLGLVNHTEHFSYGQIDKSRVYSILSMADQVGMDLGALKGARIKK